MGPKGIGSHSRDVSIDVFSCPCPCVCVCVSMCVRAHVHVHTCTDTHRAQKRAVTDSSMGNRLWGPNPGPCA